jgi:hypothetical protein
VFASPKHATAPKEETMGGIGRIFAIVLVFGCASIAWLVLGAVTSERSSGQRHELRGAVQDLWGSPQAQTAPSLAFRWDTARTVTRQEIGPDGVHEVTETVTDSHEDRTIQLARSDIDVGLRSDLRRKGLSWYSLYDVDFGAAYHYRHEREEEGTLDVAFAFPTADGLYDGLVFTVNGRDFAHALDSTGAGLHASVPVSPGDDVAVAIAYRSRGLDQWSYAPTPGVARLESFRLAMHTSFDEIDFPPGTLSPSTRDRRADGGWDLAWTFDSIVTGHGIGMITPTHVQPGELATVLSLSAPLSLFFFFLVIYVLATLRRIDIHPMNYFLIAGAFFAFHLLFAYSADHLPVEGAFALSSVVSVALVVSYLRLVVSPRFAAREASAAQVVYLVGFSLAHFWEGFTGLTVTVLAILTLFVLMQLTGRVRWSEVLRGTTREPSTSPPAAT